MVNYLIVLASFLPALSRYVNVSKAITVMATCRLLIFGTFIVVACFVVEVFAVAVLVVPVLILIVIV